jgi:nucleotide-binding universal stress UspA family protein
MILFKQILLPTDGSEAAYRAAKIVADLVSRSDPFPDLPDQALVTVVLALSPLKPGETDLDDGALSGRNEDMRREARDQLARTADLFGAQGIPAAQKILDGEPASYAIVRELESGAYDLIVLGSNGLGLERDEDHYVGSIADRVMRQVSLPVLVVPVPEPPEGHPAEVFSVGTVRA